MKLNILSPRTVLSMLFLLFSSAKVFAQAPAEDFRVCNRWVQAYDQAILLEGFSPDSAFTWIWELYDSITEPEYPRTWDQGAYEYYDDGPNALLTFWMPGTYTVEFKAAYTSGVKTVKKVNYITVHDYPNMNLGYGPVSYRQTYGILYDYWGPYQNYSNNTKYPPGGPSFLSNVSPDGQPFHLDFSMIRLADVYDSIKVYDDSFMNPAKLLAVYNSNNNGTFPKLITSSNKIFVTFSTDSSGVDSGFCAFLYTAGNKFERVQNFQLGHSNPVLSGTSKFYNINQNIFSREYDKKWYVNGVLQSAWNDKDTFEYTFADTGYHIICLHANKCDTIFDDCDTIYIDPFPAAYASVKALQQKQNLRVYPNPGNGVFHVVLPESMRPENSSIEIYSTSGVQVYSTSAKGQDTGIDLSYLPQGLYIVRVKNNNSLLTSGIVKQ